MLVQLHARRPKQSSSTYHVPVHYVLTLLALLAFSSAACTQESPDTDARPNPSPSVETSPVEEPSPDATTAPDCPNQDSVTSNPEATRPRSAEGDIDGDGTSDTVGLAVDSQGPPGCRAFVVVETTNGDLIEEIDDPELSTELGFPAVEGIVSVDDLPGDEVVVRITAGASTAFSGLFTVHEGVLTRVRVARGNINGDLFASGGSVGHIEGADCENGRVVVSLALPAGKGYELTRTMFEFEGAQLLPIDKERSQVSAGELDQFPEFTGPPFAHCG
jgi:hypothetical protein